MCFVRSLTNGHVYELDGDRKGLLDKGALVGPGEDLLSEAVLNIIREFIRSEKDANSSFSLMALVAT